MDPKLPEDVRRRCGEQRLSPNATDDEVAAAFVYGAGNTYQDNCAVMSLVAILSQIRGDERRKIASEMSREANRIFNFPNKRDCNVLDKVSNYLRLGESMVWESDK